MAGQADTARAACIQAAYRFLACVVRLMVVASVVMRVAGTLKGIRRHVSVCKRLAVEQRLPRYSTAPVAFSSASGTVSHGAGSSRFATTRELQAASSCLRACLLRRRRDFGTLLVKHFACRNRGLRLERAITLTDLPPPVLDAGASAATRRFCLRKFPDSGQGVNHTRVGCLVQRVCR